MDVVFRLKLASLRDMFPFLFICLFHREIVLVTLLSFFAERHRKENYCQRLKPEVLYSLSFFFLGGELSVLFIFQDGT